MTFSILHLDGTVYDTRPTYYLALMHGYLKLRAGNFTVESTK